MKLTQKYIRSLFNYKDGFLYWKIAKGNRIKINDKAGSLNDRYYHIGINGKQYKNHRIIFLYHHGYLPKEIDHIDGNSLNNLIGNLRDVTHQQNNMNRKPNKNTSSKYKGVYFNKQNKKWISQIQINKKIIYLGSSKLEKDAAKVYNDAAIEYYGEYACLNEV